jgi:small subunit ribosomal protein S20
LPVGGQAACPHWKPLFLLSKDSEAGYNIGLFPEKPGSFQSQFRPQRALIMANSKQAEKRARQATKQRAQNMSQRSTLRTAIKKVTAAIAKGDKAAAEAVFKESTSIIDRIADKKIIHKNKAARHKSRLSAAVKGLAQA